MASTAANIHIGRFQKFIKEKYDHGKLPGGFLTTVQFSCLSENLLKSLRQIVARIFLCPCFEDTVYFSALCA